MIRTREISATIDVVSPSEVEECRGEMPHNSAGFFDSSAYAGFAQDKDDGTGIEAFLSAQNG